MPDSPKQPARSWLIWAFLRPTAHAGQVAALNWVRLLFPDPPHDVPVALAVVPDRVTYRSGEIAVAVRPAREDRGGWLRRRL